MILLSPLIIIDVLIIYLLSGSVSSMIKLLLLLLIFYVVSFVISIIVDGVIDVLGDVFDLKAPKILSSSLDLLISLGVLILVHSYFTTINLSILIMVLIVIVHALAGHFINILPGNEEVKDELDPSIEYEIEQLLHEKNSVECIEQVSENHPELSKKKVIKAVRRISIEVKGDEMMADYRDSDYFNRLTDNLKQNENISYDHLMFLLHQGREIDFTYNGVDYFIAHVKEGRVLWHQEHQLSDYYDERNEAFVEETKINQVSLADIFRQRKAMIVTIW